MDLKLAVENLGLSDKEAEVYLALLKLGKTTAYGVAKKSGMKKPTTYVILENLREKGFVFKISQGKKNFFKAESPEKCFEKIKEKMEFTKDALPELLAIKKGEQLKIKVSHYEGIAAIKEMEEKMLQKASKMAKKNETKAFLGNPDEKSDELAVLEQEITRQRSKKGILSKIIMPNHAENEKKLEKLGYLPSDKKIIPSKKYSSPVSIEICDSLIKIVSLKEAQGILINNVDIAKALGQIFDMNWELLSVGERFIFDSKNQQKKGKEIKTDEEIDIKINRLADL